MSITARGSEHVGEEQDGIRTEAKRCIDYETLIRKNMQHTQALVTSISFLKSLVTPESLTLGVGDQEYSLERISTIVDDILEMALVANSTLRSPSYPQASSPLAPELQNGPGSGSGEAASVKKGDSYMDTVEWWKRGPEELISSSLNGEATRERPYGGHKKTHMQLLQELEAAAENGGGSNNKGQAGVGSISRMRGQMEDGYNTAAMHTMLYENPSWTIDDYWKELDSWRP